MRLVKVRVTDFKSVRDSNEFSLGDVTCLVGKNEAGKTAILEAIYRLHPIIADHGKFDVTNDYPRVDVEDYLHAVESGTKKPANVITAVYEMTDEEIAPVEKQFGKGIFVSRLATLQRGYENTTTFVINLNESVAVRHLVSLAELSDDVRARASQLGSLRELNALLEATAVGQDKAFKEAVAASSAITDPAEQARTKDEANKLQESQSAKQLRADIPVYLKDSLAKYIWDKYLDARMPQFLYFDEYYQMEGQVNIQKLKERQANKTLTESDRPMLGLIELARLDVDQLLASKDTRSELVREALRLYFTVRVLPTERPTAAEARAYRSQ